MLVSHGSKDEAVYTFTPEEKRLIQRALYFLWDEWTSGNHVPTGWRDKIRSTDLHNFWESFVHNEDYTLPVTKTDNKGEDKHDEDDKI